MTDLILHRGGSEITRDELDLIPLPKSTKSYCAVSHYELSKTILTIGQDILSDYLLVGENYGIARKGNQLFAVLKFKDHNKDMALSIGFRNSYDQSMSIGFCIGASVFVCDNLSLCGDITIMRKHTKNVWSRLEDLIITTLYKSQHTFNQILTDSEIMRGRQIDNNSAFKALGLLFGKGILSPRQLPVAKAHWLKPEYKEFKDRNAWSFYNACTESLKSSPPISAMERYVNLHKTIIDDHEVWQ